MENNSTLLHSLLDIVAAGQRQPENNAKSNLALEILQHMDNQAVLTAYLTKVKTQEVQQPNPEACFPSLLALGEQLTPIFPDTSGPLIELTWFLIADSYTDQETRDSILSGAENIRDLVEERIEEGQRGELPTEIMRKLYHDRATKLKIIKVLNSIYGMNSKDISQVIGVSESTVQKKMKNIPEIPQKKRKRR